MELFVNFFLFLLGNILNYIEKVEICFGQLEVSMKNRVLNRKYEEGNGLSCKISSIAYYVYFYPYIIFDNLYIKMHKAIDTVFKVGLYFLYFFIVLAFKIIFLLDSNIIYRCFLSIVWILIYNFWINEMLKKTNELYLKFLFFFFYFLILIFYACFRYVFITFLAVNFKHKEFFRTLYTSLIFLSTNYIKMNAILFTSSILLFMLTIVESKSLQPPKFFKKFLHQVLTEKHNGGVDLLNQVMTSKYSFYVKCNPCYTMFDSFHTKETGHLVKRRSGNNNKIICKNYNFDLNENTVKLIIYDCGGSSVNYKVLISISGVINQSVLKEGDSRSVESILNCLEWYSLNPKLGIYKGKKYNHCLDFIEIMDSIFLEKRDFIRKSNNILVENYGSDESEIYDYLTQILNYKAKFIKTLFYHNKLFFGMAKPTVLLNLLENKAAIGEKNLGSSVYKKYCSEVNHIIYKSTGKPKYIKMSENRPLSEKFKHFLEGLESSDFFKTMSKKIKVKVSFKETKKDLYERLKAMGRANTETEGIEFFHTEQESLVKNKPEKFEEPEELVHVKINNKETFAEILRRNLDEDLIKKHLLGEKRNELTVPEVFSKKIKTKVGEEFIDPKKVFDNCRNRMRPRDTEKINSFISENDVSEPENSAILKRYLWNTRVVKKSDFIKEVYEETVVDNQIDIDTTVKFNEQVREENVLFEQKQSEIKSDFAEISKNLTKLKKYVSNENRKRRGEGFNLKQKDKELIEIDLKNYFSCLSEKEEIVLDEETNKNGSGKTYENSVKIQYVSEQIKKQGAVRFSKSLLGKAQTKGLFSCKDIDKTIFESDAQKTEIVSCRFERIFKTVLKNKINSSNTSIMGEILKGEKWISKKIHGINKNQLIRRIKKCGENIQLQKQKERKGREKEKEKEKEKGKGEEKVRGEGKMEEINKTKMKIKIHDFPELEKFIQILKGQTECSSKNIDMFKNINCSISYFST